jgi:hypothetical protein
VLVNIRVELCFYPLNFYLSYFFFLLGDDESDITDGVFDTSIRVGILLCAGMVEFEV